MRNEETERDENEYQYLILPQDPSGKKTEWDAEGKPKEDPEKDKGLSLSWALLDEQKGETADRPVVQTEAPSVQEIEEKTLELSSPEPVRRSAEAEAKTLPEEPDLELLAEQIREEMKRENAPQSEDAYSEPIGAETSVESEDEPVEKKLTPEKSRIQKIRGLFEYVETFCVALAVMILLFLFVFRYVSVDGDSMEHTLHGDQLTHHADRLIISDFLYEPKTGDIVVINTGVSEQPLIKRVIAVGGQTVRINFETWEVFVDGVLLEEDYIWRRDGKPMEDKDMAEMYGIDENGVCEFTVGEGRVFVMGDNRNNSKDSRFREIGEQDVEHILGKVILRLYPLSEFGSV